MGKALTRNIVRDGRSPRSSWLSRSYQTYKVAIRQRHKIIPSWNARLYPNRSVDSHLYRNSGENDTMDHKWLPKEKEEPGNLAVRRSMDSEARPRQLFAFGQFNSHCLGLIKMGVKSLILPGCCVWKISLKVPNLVLSIATPSVFPSLIKSQVNI